MSRLLLSLLLVGSVNLWAAPQSIAIKNAKGEEVGTAMLSQLKDGVKIEISVHGLKPGPHAMHFHDKGSCQAPKFESAGGHFAPDKKSHGFDSAEGPHAGDMPNFYVGADGTAKVEAINTNVSLDPGPKSLAKKGGTALVIHAGADDYKSQPAGNAGDREACGEIKGS